MMTLNMVEKEDQTTTHEESSLLSAPVIWIIGLVRVNRVIRREECNIENIVTWSVNQCRWFRSVATIHRDHLQKPPRPLDSGSNTTGMHWIGAGHGWCSLVVPKINARSVQNIQYPVVVYLALPPTWSRLTALNDRFCIISQSDRRGRGRFGTIATTWDWSTWLHSWRTVADSCSVTRKGTKTRWKWQGRIEEDKTFVGVPVHSGSLIDRLAHRKCLVLRISGWDCIKRRHGPGVEEGGWCFYLNNGQRYTVSIGTSIFLAAPLFSYISISNNDKWLVIMTTTAEKVVLLAAGGQCTGGYIRG